MRILKFSKKLLLIFCSALFFLQLLLSSFMSFSVFAEDTDSGSGANGIGSNARVRANIQWAQKKSFSDMSAEDLNSLTYEDLRMLGVFMSNFYVPWATTLGVSQDEEGMMEKFQDALVKQLNFDKDVAAALVPMLWEMSLSSAKELKIGVGFEYDDGKGYVNGANRWTLQSAWHNHCEQDIRKGLTWESANDAKLFTNDDGSFKGTYYNFLTVCAADCNQDDAKPKDVDTDEKLDKYDTFVTEPGRNGFCLYWEDDSNTPHIVFDSGVGTKPDGNKVHLNKSFTPSTAMYGILNDTLNYGNGIGSSLISIDLETFKSLNEADKEKVMVDNYLLYVDCFGNIFVDTGIERIILFPACTNPFAWGIFNDENNKATQGDFITDDKMTCDICKSLPLVGNNMPMINNFIIGEVQAGHIVKFNVDRNDEDEIIYGSTPYFLDYIDTDTMYEFGVYAGGQSLFNLNLFRVIYGNNETDIDANVGWWNDDDKYLRHITDNVGFDGELKNKQDDDLSEGIIFPSWGAYRNNVKEGHNASLASTGNYTSDNNRVPFALSDDYYGVLCNADVPFLSIGEKDGVREFNAPLQELIVIDNYGGFKSLDADKMDSVLQVANLFNDDGSTANKKPCTLIGAATSGSGVNSFSSIGTKNSVTNISNSSMAKQFYLSIFLTYLYAYYDQEDGVEHKLPYYYAKDSFPPVSTEAIDWGDIEIENTAMQEELQSLIYYFLHPKKGLEVVKQWFKNKVSGILCGWHEDMVGAGDGVATTGSTRFIGFSGYVTIPNLDDLSWTSWLLNQYDAFVVYLIIVIIILMLGYVMLGMMNLQRAIMGVLIFSICAYLPPKLIDSTVNASNAICDKIYSSKFTYWALVQHNQYATQLEQAIDSEDRQGYLSTIFGQQAASASSDYAVVSIRWQCPKKENYAAEVKKEISSVTNSSVMFNIVSGLVNSQISGETFDEAADNLYLYRDYTDVANYAKVGYTKGVEYYNIASGQDGVVDDYDLTSVSNSCSNITGGKFFGSGDLAVTADADTLIKWADSNLLLNCNYQNYSGFNESYYNGFLKLGFHADHRYNMIIYSCYPNVARQRYGENGANPNLLVAAAYQDGLDNGFLVGGNTCTSGALPALIPEYNYHIFNFMGSLSLLAAESHAFISSPVQYSSVSGVPEYMLKLHLNGLPQECFNNTLRMLNSEELNVVGTTTPVSISNGTDSAGDKLQLMDAVSLFNFALYTESPFYYFSYNLRDQLNALRDSSSGVDVINTYASYSDISSTATYLDLFTAKNQGYFYNNVMQGTGYGEMRDFMDMRDLFWRVIPYLRMANERVLEWDREQGLWMYDDTDLQYDENNELVLPSDIEPDSDAYYRYWHNANVAQLLNMYTPWVDTMLSCEYAQADTIYVLGEKKTLSDPLDPLKFELDSGRPMVFSRSEMAYYGLKMEDLSLVEQRIIEMYDEVYEALLPLMDYYDFNEDVINTAAAMLETFAFNKQFSEINLIGEDYTLYPQNYELKNFSYDAFLRLILSETTGLDINESYKEVGGSMYQAVVQNSSITTGIMFILVDVLACYAIPALKLFFLIAIFFMSVLLILSATIKIEMSLPKVLWTSLVSPLLKFFGVTVGMAFAVSLFMTDGNTDVTHRGGFTISLGDPVMVLLVMLLINVIVLILYFKIVKKCFMDCFKYAKAVFQNVKGLVGGLATGAVMGVAGAFGGSNSGTGGSGNGSGGSGIGGFGAGAAVGAAAGIAGASAAQRGASNTTRSARAVGSSRGNRSAIKAAKYKQKAKSERARNKYNDKINKGKDKMSNERAADRLAEAERARGRVSERNAEREAEREAERAAKRAEFEQRAKDREFQKSLNDATRQQVKYNRTMQNVADRRNKAIIKSQRQMQRTNERNYKKSTKYAQRAAAQRDRQNKKMERARNRRRR